MAKQLGGSSSPGLVRFGVKVPPFVEHKKNKLSKCFFAREGAVVAQYEDTSALRLFRLTTSNEFVETKLFSALPPALLMAVQWPFVATVHKHGDGGDELLRIFDLGQEAFPQLTQAIPRTQDEITGLFVDQERVFLVKRDAIFHFYGFDFSLFGGDTKCFAVPMQPRLPFRPQHEQSMQRGRRALLIGGTKLVLIDLMSGRELVPSRALDMPVRDVDFNDDVVVATTHTSLYVVPCAGGEGARVAMSTTSTCVQLVAQQRLLIGHVDGTVALWSVDAEPRRLRLFGAAHVAAPAGLGALESIMAFAVRRLLALSDEGAFIACTGTRDASAYSLHSDEARALETVTLKEPFMNIALFGDAVHFLGTSSLSVWRVTAPAAAPTAIPLAQADPHHQHAHSSGEVDAASPNSPTRQLQAKRRGSSLALVFKRSNRDKEKHKDKELKKTRSEVGIDRTSERVQRDWTVTQGAISLADSSGDTRNTSSDKSSVDPLEEDEDEDVDEDDESGSGADRTARRTTPPSSSSPIRRRQSSFAPGSHRSRPSNTSASSSPEKLRVGLVSTVSMSALPPASSSPLDARRRRSREYPSPSNSAEASGSGGSSPSTALSSPTPGTPLTLAARSSRRGQSPKKPPSFSPASASTKQSQRYGSEASTTSSGSDDLERQLQRAHETIRKQEDTISRLRKRLARYETDAGNTSVVDEERDGEKSTLDTTST